MAAQRVPDPYRVLGLARGATGAQVKSAHRALAKRYHPDAPQGDARRFLQVQEAYKLLSDPVRRREWDARHAPGPVRADEGGAPRVRRPASTPRPDPRRPARSRAAPPPASGPSPAGSPPTGPSPAGPSPAAEPARPPAGGANWTAAASADFDVYDRSSGAAWSSAARAYFRRYDAELPRRGSFHHQGTQPLTAARARAAAAEEARRRARASTDAATNRRGPAAASQAASPSSASPQGTPRTSEPAREARPTATAAPRRPFAYAGVARDSAEVSRLRALGRQQARSSRWPSLGQRLVYALLAWVPVAVVIGYGGAAVAGCDVGGSACPAWFVPAQSVATALALGLLVALPRVAFLAAAGGVGAVTAALATVLVVEVLGRRPPLTPGLLGTAALLLAGIYLGVIGLLLLNQRLLPWHMPRSPLRARVPRR